ncbi:MAG: response regulator [Eubacterium sp.]|nr:response regulator [Eubacterium sp.]
MYRVIIADDEEKICKLIQILVDWEAKGLEIAGVAHDGREALELVKEQGADIIITDIRMPELNGLDLVEAIKNARPDISCVIISGYQEFEYARRALQYGVEEYLLKPIREEELNRVLDEIISKKDLIRQESEEKAAMEITSSEQKKKMHKLLVRNLAEENQDLRGKTREVLEKEYYCSLPGSASVLFGVKVHMFSEPGGHEGLTLALNQWEQAAAEVLEKNAVSFWETVLLDDILFCFINYPVEMRAAVLQMIRDTERKYLHNGLYNGKIRYTVGISGIHTDPASWYLMGGEVRAALADRFRKDHRDTIQFWERRQAVFHLGEFINMPLQNRILEAVEQRKSEPVLDAVRVLDERIAEEPELDGTFIFSIWEELISLVLIGYKNILSDDERELQRKNALARMKGSAGQRELREQVEFSLRQIRKQGDQILKERSSKPVEEAKQYVALHFSENCGLEEVSSHVGLNPSYFSALFKREEEVGFVEYVTGVRIQRAKELLMDRERKVLEIAQSVGYQDEKYFSRAFRKNVGLSPREYRRLYC